MEMKIIAVALVLLALIPMASGTSFTYCQQTHGERFCKEVQTAVAEDKTVIAAGSDTGIIGMFTPDGSLRWAYDTGDDITGIDISHDGRFVRAGSYAGNLYFFDINGNLLLRYNVSDNHTMYVPSNDGRSVYDLSSVWNKDRYSGESFRPDMGIVQIYNNGTVIPRPEASDLSGNSQPCSGSLAVSFSGGSSVCPIIGFDAGGIRWEKVVPDYINDLARAENGCTIAARGDHTLYVLDSAGEFLWNITPHYLMRSVAVSADGEYIAVGTQYRLLYFNRSGSQLREYSFGDYVGNVRIVNNGRYISAQSGGTPYCLEGNGTPGDIPYNLYQACSEGLVARGNSSANTFTITDPAGKTITVDMNTVSPRPMMTVRPEASLPVPGPETAPPLAVPGSLPDLLPEGIALLVLVALAALVVAKRKK